MTGDIRILVAMHKPCQYPDDEMYLPIQVGMALGREAFIRQGDNTGEHISEKNKNYCELTAVYWAYKNLDADVIGLDHYRRYFSLSHARNINRVLDRKQLEKYLEKTDIILPKKRNYVIETNESQYLHAHHSEGWNAMCRVIYEDYPEYVPALEQMKKSTKGHRFNMFIMKRNVFEEYCEWLFGILFRVEEMIDISGYSVSEARVFGYLSERMLDVWINTKKYPYQEIPVVFMEKQNWVKKIWGFLKRKYK